MQRSEDLLEWFTGYGPTNPGMAVCLPVEGLRIHSCSVYKAGFFSCLQYMLESRGSRLMPVKEWAWLAGRERESFLLSILYIGCQLKVWPRLKVNLLTSKIWNRSGFSHFKQFKFKRKNSHKHTKPFS